MAELLRDNLEAQRKGHPAGTRKHLFIHSSSPEARSPGHRNLGAVLWGVYGGGGERVPGAYPQALVYQTLMVREARRCGDRGGLTYDSFFRPQMAGEWRGEEWGRLNPICSR